MPVADAAAAAAAAGAAVVAAACVATINCHNFCAAIPQALGNFHRRVLSLPLILLLSLTRKKSALNIVAHKFRLSLRQSCRLWHCIGWLS